ncbi:MAG: NlpC/P60 family protein [Defluviitaleaceae bacterium]|nr:NlpC/P60 family protein [Defluviitaleaceae bacterium]
MRREPKKGIRLRILLCMITAALTLVCMVAVVSAEGDGDSAPAAQAAGDAAQPETVQYTAVVVDAATGAAVPNAEVSLAGLAAKGQTYGNETYFTVPAGSDIQAKVSAEGYYPAKGKLYSGAASDIVETITLKRNPMTNTDPTGLSNDVTGTDLPQMPATATDLQPSAEPGDDPATEANLPEAAVPAESAPPGDVPGTYTDLPVSAAPMDMTPMDDSGLDQENQNVEAQTPVNESGAVPDAPPAWAESGQPYIKGNLGMAEELRLLQSALDERVAAVRAAFDADASVQITYDADNMADIWAIYAVKSGMTDNYPYNVEFQTQEQSDILRSVFWDMTNVTATVQVVGGERSCVIRVERKTCADVMDSYGLADQASELAALTTPDMRDTVNSQLSNSILSILSDDEFQSIERQLQGVSGERRDVVLAALSLEGKISYFWGGKSYHVGWDDRWGEDRLVTAAGASQTGTVRPFGLDCSGFVSWAFINAGGDQNIINYIGNGTSMQWYNSKAIGMDQLRPGDLLFYKPPGGTGVDHVGIYIGDNKVVHCTTNGGGGVIVTGLGKFIYARTPYIYGDD